MAVYDTLKSLGISLPPVTPPVAAFVPWVRSGNLLFLSGHIAKKDGKPWTGQLGVSLTTEDGKQAARAVAIDLMGTLQAASGDLERVRQIAKLMVLVNSGPSFVEQHLVANGASELFQQVFGERGTHTRSAFGVAQVPFGSCVEIELIAELGEAAPTEA
jgi:enamine deaminase RidA (YjgF/YER057c/UK114 family)